MGTGSSLKAGPQRGYQGSAAEWLMASLWHTVIKWPWSLQSSITWRNHLVTSGAGDGYSTPGKDNSILLEDGDRFIGPVARGDKGCEWGKGQSPLTAIKEDCVIIQSYSNINGGQNYMKNILYVFMELQNELFLVSFFVQLLHDGTPVSLFPTNDKDSIDWIYLGSYISTAPLSAGTKPRASVVESAISNFTGPVPSQQSRYFRLVMAIRLIHFTDL